MLGRTWRNAGEQVEGYGAACEVLEILGQAAASSEPNKAALADPALGKHDEAGCFVTALDDIELPIGNRVKRRCELRAYIAAIARNLGEEREQTTDRLEQRQALGRGS